MPVSSGRCSSSSAGDPSWWWAAVRWRRGRWRSWSKAGARVTVVAPRVRPEIASSPGVSVIEREFAPGDLDGAWIAVAAAPPDVNRAVAAAGEARRVFVNAVDDVRNGSAYTAGVIRRSGVTIAVSTEGRAPALAGLLREGIEALLPDDLDAWVDEAGRLREQQRAGRVPMRERRPGLLCALNGLYAARGASVEPMNGFVSLVGAGPGDPDLLTIKAARRLGEADLVLYDALVSGEVLQPGAGRASLSRRQARGPPLGEPGGDQPADDPRARRGASGSCGSSAATRSCSAEAARRLEALVAAGIPFEVVPGLTSAIAAPALSGIPVTHRGLASGFAVVSGHAESAYRPILEGVAPNSLTLVVLMGLGSRGELARLLISRGWRSDTPAAICFAAATPRARTWMTSLRGLADAAHGAEGTGDAGTIVIGDVVGLAAAQRSSHPARVAAVEAV